MQTIKREPNQLAILTFAEAANWLRISQRTLYDLVHDRQIPFFRVGRQYRFSTAELQQWSHEECRHTTSDHQRHRGCGESVRFA